MNSVRFALVVALLLWGAYWAALPWIDCVRPAFTGVAGIDLLRPCTIGIGIAGFGNGFYPNLIAGLVYLVTAAWIALTRRTRV